MFAKGKTISVPKKPLTAYAIFVKKMRRDYQQMLKSDDHPAEMIDENGDVWDFGQILHEGLRTLL